MLRLLSPALMALLCLALVGTPVTYRGGSADAHPHMFLEFMLDARSGSFTHHHVDEPDQTHTGGHAHDHGTAKSTRANADPDAAQPRLAGADNVAPTLSAFVVGDVSKLALLLPQNEAPPTREVSTAFAAVFGTRTGLTHAPTAPPPR